MCVAGSVVQQMQCVLVNVPRPLEAVLGVRHRLWLEHRTPGPCCARCRSVQRLRPSPPIERCGVMSDKNSRADKGNTRKRDAVDGR